MRSQPIGLYESFINHQTTECAAYVCKPKGMKRRNFDVITMFSVYRIAAFKYTGSLSRDSASRYFIFNHGDLPRLWSTSTMLFNGSTNFWHMLWGEHSSHFTWIIDQETQSLSWWRTSHRYISRLDSFLKEFIQSFLKCRHQSLQVLSKLDVQSVEWNYMSRILGIKFGAIEDKMRCKLLSVIQLCLIKTIERWFDKPHQ